MSLQQSSGTTQTNDSIQSPTLSQTDHDWPHYIANITCGVVLMVIAIVAIFFVIATRIEESVVTKNVQSVVDGFTSDITSFLSPQALKNNKTRLSNSLVLSKTSLDNLHDEDKHVEVANSKLTKSAIIAMISLGLLGTFIIVGCYIMSRKPGYKKFNLINLLGWNLGLTALASCSYIAFLYGIGAQLICADQNHVKASILSSSMNYAGISVNPSTT